MCTPTQQDCRGEREVSNIFCITQNELHGAIHKQVFTVRAHAWENVDDFNKTVTQTRVTLGVTKKAWKF
jgi:hypothetical protein